MNEYQLPSDFEGYIEQLIQALKRAKETGDTSFAEKAFEMIIDDINGMKTSSSNQNNQILPDTSETPPMNNRLNEALKNYKRLF